MLYRGRTTSKRRATAAPAHPLAPTNTNRFTLYALDAELEMAAGATREQVLAAVRGHILARGQLTGTYQR